MTAKSLAADCGCEFYAHDLCALCRDKLLARRHYDEESIIVRMSILHICLTHDLPICFVRPPDRAFFVTFHMAMEAEQQGRADVSVSPDFSEMPDDRHIEFQVSLVGRDYRRRSCDTHPAVETTA